MIKSNFEIEIKELRERYTRLVIKVSQLHTIK